jgi:hypothetical protein
MAVDEHQTRRPGDIGQRRHRGQEHRAVSAINQRELPAGQGGLDPVIDRGHHVQEGALVQETKAATRRNRR